MQSDNSEAAWPRMIALVDMNCFFAQIEQQDNPYWRNRPVGVTNGKLGSTIITASYEARSYGVNTGMRLYDARKLCPDIIQAPSRPNRYATVSSAIMESLFEVSPTIEVYSVDEAFIDLTDCQKLYESAEHVGQLIKDTISQVSGLTCSVGVSGDKTTAKFAAKLVKPDGLTVIYPWNAEKRLANELVTELSGINKGIAHFLARYGVTRCGDMKRIPMSLVAKRFGNSGRRIWLMAQGKDPEPVITSVNAPKTVGHGKVMPPRTCDLATVLTYLQHMSEKVGRRLRKHHLLADKFFIGIRLRHRGWLATKVRLEQATNDGAVIYDLCKGFVDSNYHGEDSAQVQVTALEPSMSKQMDMFIDTHDKQKREALNHAVDQINSRYGEFTVAPTRVIGRSEMPNVIAPAWKPSGHRKTV